MPLAPGRGCLLLAGRLRRWGRGRRDRGWRRGSGSGGRRGWRRNLPGRAVLQSLQPAQQRLGGGVQLGGAQLHKSHLQLRPLVGVAHLVEGFLKGVQPWRMVERLKANAWPVITSSSWGEHSTSREASFMVLMSISPRKYSAISSHRRLMSLDSRCRPSMASRAWAASWWTMSWAKAAR